MKRILLWTVAVCCVFVGHSFAALVPGDIDGNQIMDSQDVLKAAQFLAGNLPLEKRQGTDQYGMADVDRNGEVNASDLVRMQNYIVGNDVELVTPMLFVEYIGSGSTGTVGQLLPESVGVRLTVVANWAPLEGMNVQFVIADGNGSVQPNSVDTNADGEALTQWVLGTVSSCLGKDNVGQIVWKSHDRLSVTLQGYDPVYLYAYATPDEPDHMTDSWTEPTVSLIKTYLHYYFNIHLYDQYNNPVPYYPISFSTLTWPTGASGYSIVPYDPPNFQTSRYGTTSPRMLTGNRPGQYVFQALVQPAGGSPITITETADTSTGPAVVCFSSGNWQTGINGETLANLSRFGAMEYFWNEPSHDYIAGYYDDVWLDMTVVADPPSDPVFGSASPTGGFTDVPWSGITTFQTTVTLPEATKLPTTAHLYAVTTDARFTAPFNQIAGGAYIIPDRHLEIFLDADGTWETDHRDDAPYYLPGSKLLDAPTDPGQSEAVPSAESVPVHTVRIIAAFYDRDGQLTSPPEGVTQVRVTLEETSAYRGIAMNYGINDELDFRLVDGGQAAQNVTAAFSIGNYAVVELHVYDYGGHTRVRASCNEWYDIAEYGEKTLLLPLPVFEANNWLPQSGYLATGSADSGLTFQISTSGLTADADIDDTPTATLSGGNVNTTLIGDGLTNYEEYRGFVCRGVHLRTHPQVKDFFFFMYRVDSQVRQILPNPDWIALEVGFMSSSGLYVHDLDEGSVQEVPRPNSIGYSVNFINRNYTNTNGPNLLNHFAQRAVNVRFDRQIPDESLTHGVTITRSGVPDIPLNVSHCTIFVNRIDHMEDHTTGSIMAVDSVFRLNVYRYLFTHELGHSVHMCHNDGSANPCSDNALIVPAPTPPNNMFIMQSGLFPEANKLSVNPTRQYPS